MSLPAPTPALISVLVALVPEVDARISTELDSDLPAIRVVKTGDHEPPSDWEATPIFQVEVWDHDELAAERLAWAIRSRWPSVLQEIHDEALVLGRWVATNPRTVSDPDTGLARVLFEVGLRLTGAPT